MLEIFSHEFFWLSFAPLSFLSAGFWLLLFDRADRKIHSFFLLILALVAGFFSAISFLKFADFFEISNFFAKIFFEEFFKIFFAILILELFKKKFVKISDGVIFGFAVGLGFAMCEQIFALAKIFETAEFEKNFWLIFQGRFYTTTLLHATATAFFGFFYAGAFLSKTLKKRDHRSPLATFLLPPRLDQIFFALTLHVARRHFLLQNNFSVREHFARAVIFEGFFVAIIFHSIFNFAIEKNFFALSFFIAISATFFLAHKISKI